MRAFGEGAGSVLNPASSPPSPVAQGVTLNALCSTALRHEYPGRGGGGCEGHGHPEWTRSGGALELACLDHDKERLTLLQDSGRDVDRSTRSADPGAHGLAQPGQLEDIARWLAVVGRIPAQQASQPGIERGAGRQKGIQCLRMLHHRSKLSARTRHTIRQKPRGSSHATTKFARGDAKMASSRPIPAKVEANVVLDGRSEGIQAHRRLERTHMNTAQQPIFTEFRLSAGL